MTTPEAVEQKERTIVAGLPWRKERDQDEVDSDSKGRHDETWYLDIDGIHVWVKHYTRSFEDWRGWRVGRGGSPLLRLNERRAFEDREAAMTAAVKVARKTAMDHLLSVKAKLDDAIRALDEVTMPL